METFVLEEDNGRNVTVTCSPRTRDRMMTDSGFRNEIYERAMQQEANDSINASNVQAPVDEPFRESQPFRSEIKNEASPSPAALSPPSRPSNSDPSTDICGSKKCWLEKDVKLLISLYKELHDSLGKTVKCKSKARMYREISKRMTEKDPDCTYTAIQVEIKWRNLEKHYKNSLQHNNKTGRNRKNINYESELAEILNERAGVVPEHTLGSVGPGQSRLDILSSLDSQENKSPEPEELLETTEPPNNDTLNPSKKTPRRKPTIQAELEKFREERQASEMEKVQFRANYLAAYNRRTEAIEMKNELFKSFIREMNTVSGGYNGSEG